ncbi:cystathionine beta-lyase [Flavobacterium sp. Root901]|uniref:MalY/PatB family protein n=1 Tax=Flavobacterium sp. Root901 TaxID=1736605 RepID=UPI00070CFF71|nr:MalY/PatB family protein [Flavobacterium sp. Root901]KRD12387.1 cystathionine beta-lyase [Flavobacterium sp. Root901]
MDYNFDEIIDRKNTNAIKWDVSPSLDILPMWIADMDFKTAPEIIEALQNRVSHGIFGYTQTPEQCYISIQNWWKKQHGLSLEKEWILPVIGVIPALSAAIRSLSEKGDQIIIQPPVYNHFYTPIENCGCEIIENNLSYNNGIYTIDFEDLEIKASHPKAKLLLISNPHNPVGRVWTKEELLQIAKICHKHNVIVISDEIHCDLVFSGQKHIPFASLDDQYISNSITLASISKSFNLAGLQVGYVFTKNAELYHKVKSVFAIQEMELLSPFAIEALIAAYNKGENWLVELKKYLYHNYSFLQDFIASELPQIKVVPLQATYLVWLDCSALQLNSDEIAKMLQEEQKLWINSGTMYGKAGEGSLRINIATPQKLLFEGLQRLKKALG